MLAVDVEKRLGDFSVAAKFEAADGVTALFGPSGSGKTSIVSMVAGLVRRPRKDRLQRHGAVHFARAFAYCRTGAASAMCSRMDGCSRT